MAKWYSNLRTPDDRQDATIRPWRPTIGLVYIVYFNGILTGKKFLNYQKYTRHGTNVFNDWYRQQIYCSNNSNST